jgi:antitoxin YefM
LTLVKYYVQYFVQKQKGSKMDAISYSSARAQLASNMSRVCDNHEPIIITRNGAQSVVMLSLEDYQSLEETAYLLRSPANAKRLLDAITQLDAGQGAERNLSE